MTTTATTNTAAYVIFVSDCDGDNLFNISVRKTDHARASKSEKLHRQISMRLCAIAMDDTHEQYSTAADLIKEHYCLSDEVSVRVWNPEAERITANQEKLDRLGAMLAKLGGAPEIDSEELEL